MAWPSTRVAEWEVPDGLIRPHRPQEGLTHKPLWPYIGRIPEESEDRRMDRLGSPTGGSSTIESWEGEP
ncbi:hypothetical protein N7468_009508 [Penicillium chermesinum]|uniref:Uncharacterized protein n=1 Tax=Penicillium chermesinum TaxID=63820 RepID=A0A9W9NHV3_9EURO|nr:uncharacterized protein N7468_009508 [Penicillium chermesinum]KAJ5220304.1 hypothetical protein N7468_009508 [Penicillium chermesinum]KAJ6157747.1 hypothetical protein N7470_005339 [Penicillium chermesinum]